LRAAILGRSTAWEGEPYAWSEQLGTFGQQLRKYGRAAADEVRGKVARDGTGRDLGYPGGRRRPASFDPSAAGLPEGERP
jgi:hypothetical protein